MRPDFAGRRDSQQPENAPLIKHKPASSVPPPATAHSNRLNKRQHIRHSPDGCGFETRLSQLMGARQPPAGPCRVDGVWSGQCRVKHGNVLASFVLRAHGDDARLHVILRGKGPRFRGDRHPIGTPGTRVHTGLLIF